MGLFGLRAIEQQVGNVPDSAGREPAQRARDLQRRDGGVALSDGDRDRLARKPLLAEIAQLPFRRGDDARGFVREIDAGFRAKTRLVGVVGDVVDAGFVAHVVEVGIAGLRYAFVQRDGAVRAPALVKMPEERGSAAALKCGVFVDASAFETGDGDDRLERGAGRPLGLNRAIEQRLAGVAGQFFPVLRL